MCLESVTYTYKKPRPEEVEAWGVFTTGAIGLYFEFMAISGCRVVPTGKWITASGQLVLRTPVTHKRTAAKEYAMGFHKFATKQDAVRRASKHFSYVAVRVKLRNVTCHGRQWGSKVLVAQEMFVPK